jgi:hypothetical protein
VKKWEKRMRGEQIRQRINRGEKVINREPGNSMIPHVYSRQPCLLRKPDRPIVKGDIVYAKVKGRWYTHFVHGVQRRGQKIFYLIGNASGHMNGWTSDVVAIATPLAKSEAKRLEVQLTPVAPDDSGPS